MDTYQVVGIYGKGDNATVYKVKKNNRLYALKVIKEVDDSVVKEIDIQNRAAALGCAPTIYEDVNDIDFNQGKYHIRGARAIVMEVIETFEKKRSMSKALQRDLIKRTYTLLKNGIVHNDLHQGNVGFRKEGRSVRGIIFDFGLAEIIPPPKNPIVLRQLLVSQLYSLVTNFDCNANNNIPLCGDQPIHNAIYYAKAHSEDSLRKLQELTGDDILDDSIVLNLKNLKM